jgi:hypothetical protein
MPPYSIGLNFIMPPVIIVGIPYNKSIIAEE